MQDKAIERQLENEFAGAAGPAERALGGFQPVAHADDAPQHIGQAGASRCDGGIEALREAWRSRKVTMDELVEAAGIDRVSKIMRPYLEATV